MLTGVVAFIGLFVGAILLLQGMSRAGTVVLGLTVLGLAGVAVARLWRRREHRWAQTTLTLVLGTAAAAMLWLALTAIGSLGAAIAVLGAWGMAGAFILGLALIRAALSAGHPVLGIARTLVDEAVRMRVAVALIGGLMLLLAFVPLSFGLKERLSDRMMMLLSVSTFMSSALLSLLTIFVGCGSVCREMSRKQIYLTMTKPVRPWHYVAGKLLGMALLNLLLVALAGGMIWTYARVLERQPAKDPYDRFVVRQQVLTARAAVAPTPSDPKDLDELYRQRLEQWRREDPQQFPADQPPTERQEMMLRNAVMDAWHTIPSRTKRGYLFDGLGRLPSDAVVQLSYRVQATSATPEGRVPLAMWINGRPAQQLEPPHDTAQTINIAADYIQDGRLLIELGNASPGTVSFTPGEGLELLYQVGGFDANLARAMAVLWVKLLFVSALALAAGSMLSLPVALLASSVVWIIAAGSGALSEALQAYAFVPSGQLAGWSLVRAVLARFMELLGEGSVYEVFKLGIRLFGQLMVTVMPGLSEYDPMPLVSDGRVVTWGMLGQAFWRVGLVWTGLCGLAGWLAMSRREMARVTV